MVTQVILTQEEFNNLEHKFKWQNELLELENIELKGKVETLREEKRKLVENKVYVLPETYANKYTIESLKKMSIWQFLKWRKL